MNLDKRPLEARNNTAPASWLTGIDFCVYYKLWGCS